MGYLNKLLKFCFSFTEFGVQKISILKLLHNKEVEYGGRRTAGHSLRKNKLSMKNYCYSYIDYRDVLWKKFIEKTNQSTLQLEYSIQIL